MVGLFWKGELYRLLRCGQCHTPLELVKMGRNYNPKVKECQLPEESPPPPPWKVFL